MAERRVHEKQLFKFSICKKKGKRDHFSLQNNIQTTDAHLLVYQNQSTGTYVKQNH